MLVFALYVGPRPVADQHPALFLKSMHAAFLVFAALCFASIFASLVRGKIRPRPLTPLNVRRSMFDVGRSTLNVGR